MRLGKASRPATDRPVRGSRAISRAGQPRGRESYLHEARIAIRSGADMTALSDQELAKRVDAGACESDRAFFRQHPGHNFRLRRAWAVEMEDFARKGAIKRELPADLCWWILVHQLIPHKIRLRWPLAAPHSFSPDPPENIARGVSQAQRAALHARGLTDAEIAQLIPPQAHEILATPDPRAV